MAYRTLLEIVDAGLDAAGIVSNAKRWLLDRKDTGPAKDSSGKTVSFLAEEFTYEDEMMIVADVCAAVDGEKITPEQGVNLMLYFQEATPRLRNRFRSGFIKEANPQSRQKVIRVLANYTSAERDIYIYGAGFMDMNVVEQLLVGLEQPIRRAGAWARNPDRLAFLTDDRQRRQDERAARVAQRPVRQPLTTGRALGQMFRFNFGRRR